MIEEGPSRVPPSDIPAEACVLGAMLVDPLAVPAVREILHDSDFYRPAHQRIFEVVCWMHDHPAKWGPPDLVTVRAALAERKRLEEVGGVEYLLQITRGLPSSANVAYYANIVADKARLRGLIIAGTRAAQAGFDSDDSADDIIGEALKAMSGLGAKRERRRSKSAADLSNAVEDAISGKRWTVPWPWASITRWAKPCAPGAVSVICGNPGSGKSFLFQEAMLQWHREGVKTAMLHLEKDRRYHQTRALGQLEGNSQLLSTEWQKAHPDEARAAVKKHWDTLESYGATVWDDPDGAMTLDAVQQWIGARIAEKGRIIGVDPITAAEVGARSWEAERRFIVACESMAARAGASIVLITHPRGAGNGAPNVDSLAGGRAYGRLTDCVIWIQGHNPPEQGRVSTVFGPSACDYNRTVTLCKTRDGTGQGLSFALQFYPGTLQTTEEGPILKKAKGRKESDE